MIAETVSRKRGRPVQVVIGDSAASQAELTRFVAGDGRTDRTLRSARYRVVAIGMLTRLHEAGDHSCAWLLDPAAVQAGTQRLRPTVLAALGRLARERGEGTAVFAAREICGQRPTARTAVAYVNTLRELERDGGPA